MKTIEHGKFYQKTIIGKCNICDCIFEVEKDDDNLFYKLIQMENGQNELKLSAHCPECKGDANVEIKEKKQPKQVYPEKIGKNATITGPFNKYEITFNSPEYFNEYEITEQNLERIEQNRNRMEKKHKNIDG